MAKTTNWAQKNLTGVYHWAECADWKLYKYESIWDIPISYLEEHGWYAIEVQPFIEIPIQRLIIDKAYSSKGGFNYRNYQLLRIDWDYLLERQARLYASLHWDKEEIQQFHRTTEEWLVERTNYNKERELQQHAEELAQQFGMSVEDVLKIVTAKSPTKNLNQVETPIAPSLPEGYLKGILEKLSNEFFILVDDKDRYKLRSKNLLKEEGEPKGAEPERFIGKEYIFKFSLESPPKSRNAKGWAETLERVIS